MVIEVVVIDSDISDTSEGEGEPDVTVQGKDMRMAQATDGNWYGYFADSDAALAADATQAAQFWIWSRLRYCLYCSYLPQTATGVTLTDTVGVFIRGADAGSTTPWATRSISSLLTQEHRWWCSNYAT